MKKLVALWVTLFVVVWPSLAHAQDVPEKLESVLKESAERPFFVIAGLLFAWCATQLLKSDLPVFTRLPVPKPFRPLLAILFAQLFHAIEAMAVGIRWDVALTRGFVAGASAIGMHDNGASVIAALEWIRAKASAGGGAVGVLLIVVLAGVSSTGCTREAFLSRAVPVANTLEGQVRITGVDVNRECEVPMARAEAAKDVPAGLVIAAKCDEPVTRYEAGRGAHLLLTEAIMQVYAGEKVDFARAAALIPKAVDAGLRLVAGVRALTGGAK